MLELWRKKTDRMLSKLPFSESMIREVKKGCVLYLAPLVSALGMCGVMSFFRVSPVEAGWLSG